MVQIFWVVNFSIFVMTLKDCWWGWIVRFGVLTLLGIQKIWDFVYPFGSVDLLQLYKLLLLNRYSSKFHYFYISYHFVLFFSSGGRKRRICSYRLHEATSPALGGETSDAAWWQRHKSWKQFPNPDQTKRLKIVR